MQFIFPSSLTLLVLLLFYSSTFQFNHGGNVGALCVNDKDCGENEFCKRAGNFDRPCKLGVCTCVNCFAMNLDSECGPVVNLKIGDPCDGLNSQQQYPKYAICSPKGRVQCEWGWMAFGNACIRNTSASYGASCRWSSDCSADMWCNDENVCTCYYAYEKYDPVLELCVKKEYNDQCETSNECRVYGQHWNGFTFSTGECRNGRCECSSNAKLAITGYFDEKAKTFKSKPICVISEASINQSSGERCTVDPVYNGDGHGTSVCESSLLCHQCPEDIQMPGFTSLDGRCRKLVKAESQEDQSCETEISLTTEDYFETIAWYSSGFTDSMAINEDTMENDPQISVVDIDSPTFDGVTPNSVTFEVGTFVNGTWQSGRTLRWCLSSDDCLENEQCLTLTQCGRGICSCATPGRRTGSGNCELIDAEEKSIAMSHDRTILLSPSEDSISLTLLPGNESFYIGMNCTNHNECWGLQGAICEHSVCTCPKRMVWHPTLGCKFAQFGDPCIIDDDCDTRLYASSSGHACVNGKCGCSEEYMMISTSIVEAHWESFSENLDWQSSESQGITSYCVRGDVVVNVVAQNETCTFDLFNDARKEISICEIGVCLFCFSDTGDGFCSSVDGFENITASFEPKLKISYSKLLRSQFFEQSIASSIFSSLPLLSVLLLSLLITF